MLSIFWRRLLVPVLLYMIAVEVMNPHLAAELLQDGLHMNLQFNLDIKRGEREPLPAGKPVRPAASAVDGVRLLIDKHAGGRSGGREEF